MFYGIPVKLKNGIETEGEHGFFEDYFSEDDDLHYIWDVEDIKGESETPLTIFSTGHCDYPFWYLAFKPSLQETHDWSEEIIVNETQIEYSGPSGKEIIKAFCEQNFRSSN